MAKGVQPQATEVLADLESLALRDLGHQMERLRAALARAAPSRGDAVEHGELSRARLGASDALDLYVRVHDAGRTAMAEAQEQQQEQEMEAQVRVWHEADGAWRTPKAEQSRTPNAEQWQQQSDRRRWETPS